METDQHKEFMLLQYHKLREEILGIKERLVKLQIAGITGIPLFIGAGQTISAVMLAAPMIIIAFTFIIIFEQNSLMRAGGYIRIQIEGKFIQQGDIGWEKWIEEVYKGRWAEIFFVISVYIAFTAYFLLSVWLIYHNQIKLSDIFPSKYITILIGCYSALFIISLVALFTSLPISTKKFSYYRQERNNATPA